jgi:hypothetical protein
MKKTSRPFAIIQIYKYSIKKIQKKNSKKKISKKTFLSLEMARTCGKNFSAIKSFLLQVLLFISSFKINFIYTCSFEKKNPIM